MRIRINDRQHSSLARACLALMMTTSVAATLAGLVGLLAFNGTAGLEGVNPGRWPESTALERLHTAPTVLVFAHPLCSCSRATLEELDTVLANGRFHGAAPAVRILFSRTNPAWKPGDLWRRAEKIPNAAPAWDEGGKEARIFGVQTSGLVLVYDARGLLLFRGGITGSRGHAGSNYGADGLAAVLASHLPSRGPASRVFGCSLFSTPGSGL